MLRRPSQAIAVVLFLTAGTLSGQAPPAAPTFEVASIKPTGPLDPQKIIAGKMHIGLSIDGARVDIGNLSLMEILAFAYTLKSYQITGPAWMSTERFDVLAKLPAGTSKDQVPEMLQALLVDRFQMTVHRESKEHAVYALVVGKNGPKMKESPPEADPPAGDSAAPAPPKVDRDRKGMVVTGGRAGAMRVSMTPEGTMHMEATKATMPMFADMLSRFVDRPVVDMTELKGSYQVALDLSPEDMRNASRSAGALMGPGGIPGPPPGGGDTAREPAPAASSDPPPSSILANIQQLGLKLEPRKTPMATLVIDHAEKVPTEN